MHYYKVYYFTPTSVTAEFYDEEEFEIEDPECNALTAIRNICNYIDDFEEDSLDKAIQRELLNLHCEIDEIDEDTTDIIVSIG